jgi:hypothetical protein
MLFTFFIIEGLKKIYLAFISMYKFQSFDDKRFHFYSSAPIPLDIRYVNIPLALHITTTIVLPDRFFLGDKTSRKKKDFCLAIPILVSQK